MFVDALESRRLVVDDETEEEDCEEERLVLHQEA